MLIILLVACGKGSDVSNSYCGSYNGHSLYKGKQGGCYYKNSSGNKTYVDKKYCACM